MLPELFRNIQIKMCITEKSFGHCFEENFLPAMAAYGLGALGWSSIGVASASAGIAGSKEAEKLISAIEAVKEKLKGRYGVAWWQTVESSIALYGMGAGSGFKGAAISTLKDMGVTDPKIINSLNKMGRKFAMERTLIWAGRGAAAVGGAVGTGFLVGFSPSSIDCSSQRVSRYYEYNDNCEPTYKLGPNAMRLFSLPEKELNEALDSSPHLCKIYSEINNRLKKALNRRLKIKPTSLNCSVDGAVEMKYKLNGVMNTQKYKKTSSGKLKELIVSSEKSDRDVTLSFTENRWRKSELSKVSFPGEITGKQMNIPIRNAGKNYSGSNKHIDFGLSAIPVAQVYGPIALSCCSPGGNGCPLYFNKVRGKSSPLSPGKNKAK